MNLKDVNLQEWIGKTETSSDVVTPVPIAALAATLDTDPGDPLPPLWHWLYFLPIHKWSEVGPDGHARRGGFLPPVPLPRRMWAGGRLEFHHPLRVGESITRTSKIVDVQSKQGRSGSLVFVLVRTRNRQPAGRSQSRKNTISSTATSPDPPPKVHRRRKVPPGNE